VYIAKMLTQQGVNVITAATGHRRIFRDWGRAAIEQFAEVYLNCYMSTCIRRDSKGIYRFGLSHTSGNVPGINEMYEVPLNPELVLNSESDEPSELADQLFGWIQKHFLQQRSFVEETSR
jgi:adenylylsulfate kinase